MLETSPENVKLMVESWKIHNKNQFWVKKSNNIAKYLGELRAVLGSFNETENDFFQNFYINSSDGNIHSTKILELGEKYERAEFFFIDKILESNMTSHYYDFVFKNKIIAKKEIFQNASALSVENTLKGEDKSIISLYVFIENVAKNFNTTCADKTQRDEFKGKLVKFYDAIFKIFYTIGGEISLFYFDLVLHNQPLILVEFIKTAINATSFDEIELYLTDDGLLNFKIADNENFHRIEKNELYTIASAFAMLNETFPSFIYSAENAEILEQTFGEKISNFSDFQRLCDKFLSEFSPYPSDANSLMKYIYTGLFFDYIKNFKSEEIAKNTIFYGAVGSGKSRKIAEIIKSKKLSFERFSYISLHRSYDYSDIIDGFVGSEFANGEFKQICKKALSDPQNEYYLVIDNINCGKFDEIFGETVELLKKRYDQNEPFSMIRTKNSHIIDKFDEAKKAEFSVVVEGGKSYFAVPKNLYILCATNGKNDGISPSSAKVFNWVKMGCNYSVIEDTLNEEKIKNSAACVAVCRNLNDFIAKDGRLGTEIGHGIFMKLVDFQSNSQITQDGLNSFFSEVLEPILECCYISKNSDTMANKQISAIKDIFKL